MNFQKNNIELRYPEKLDTEEEISFIKKVIQM